MSGSRGWFAIEYELAESTVSDAALGMMVRLRHDSALMESDGLLPARMVAGADPAVITELQDAGILEALTIGHQDTGYLTWNASHADMEKKRAKWRADKVRQRPSPEMSTVESPVESAVDSNASHIQSHPQAQSHSQEVSVVPTDVGLDPVAEVFRVWKEAAGHNGRTVLSPKRRKLITEALSGYGLKDILAAVVGWQNSAHHRGEVTKSNPEGTVYNDIELLLRDAKHIEMFRDYANGHRGNGKGNGGHQTAATRQAMRHLRLAEEMEARGE